MSTDQHELEPVSFQPRPNIITAFSADASPFGAVAESVDNSIDYVRSRAYEGHEPGGDLQVTITFDPGQDAEDSEIRIEDDAGGVEPEHLSRFFQWGASVTAPESIGRFGVGASRIATLGKVIEYQSRAVGQDVGFGFEVNVAEMEEYEGEVTDETYQAERKIVEDLDEGHTRVVVRDLKRGIDEILGLEKDDGESGSDEEEVIKGFSEEDWEDGLERFGDQFGDIFEEYITNGITFEADWFEDIRTERIGVDISLKLLIGGEETQTLATPPEQIEYSYLPFDGLHPRLYSKLPFDENNSVDSEGAQLRVNIEVGLMTSAKNEKAGLTLLANDRKILSRDTENSLFSTDYLGAYRTERGHSRLSIRIEMRGETEHMPINSLKSDLDMNSPMAEPLLRIAKNAAKYYWKQDYTRMPRWLLETFEQDHDFAANGGEVREYWKQDSTTNSVRFRKQPGEAGGRRKFPERDRLRAIVKIHRILRITDKEILKPKEVDAYENYIESQLTSDLPSGSYVQNEPVSVDGRGPEFDWGDVSLTVSDEQLDITQKLVRMAKQHLRQGGRFSGENEYLAEWQVPRYHEELRRLTGLDSVLESDLEVWEQVPESVLIDELKWIAEEIEEVPTETDVQEFGAYPIDVFETQFEDFNEALGKAGFDIGSDDGGDGDNATSGESPGDGAAPTPPQTGRSERTNEDTEPATAFRFSGESYEPDESEFKRFMEILEVEDEASPEDVWNRLLDVLERYETIESTFRG